MEDGKRSSSQAKLKLLRFNERFTELITGVESEEQAGVEKLIADNVLRKQ